MYSTLVKPVKPRMDRAVVYINPWRLIGYDIAVSVAAARTLPTFRLLLCLCFRQSIDGKDIVGMTFDYITRHESCKMQLQCQARCYSGAVICFPSIEIGKGSWRFDMVRKIHKHFRYEEMRLYVGGDAFQAFPVNEVPRGWVRALEDKLYDMGGYQRDNKTGFIFTNDIGYTVAILFWDHKATWIEWKVDCWDSVPANIVCKESTTGLFIHPTKEQLNLPMDIPF